MDGRPPDCKAAPSGPGQSSVCLSVRSSVYLMLFVFCRPECENDGVWMAGPLIAKLPPQVQGRVPSVCLMLCYVLQT